MTDPKIVNTKYSSLKSFWNEDRSLSFTFFLLLIFIFVLVPVISPDGVGERFTRIVYSVMLFTAVLSVSRNKKFVTGFTIFAIVCLIINWLADYFQTRALLIVHDIASVFFNLTFAVAILIKTFKPGDITYQRIIGSIVVFLLMGMIFSYVFHAIYMYAGPPSFNNIKIGELREFMYFSFTSMTTAGYGDITPVATLARSLANMEGLFGQLFPAILIARLVSMEFESSQKRKHDE